MEAADRAGADLEGGRGGLPLISRRAAAIELGLFLALVVSFIWGWARAFPHAALVVYTAGLGLTFATHILHRETPDQIGLRLDNLLPAMRDAAVPTVPLVLSLAAAGIAGGRWSVDVFDPERILRLLAWGFLQQYLLQGFIHRRLVPLIRRPVIRELTVGGIFALIHLPNPILVPVTFLAGTVFAFLYRRQPSLPVLSLCHAIGSTAVAFAFGPEALHKMRVGPGYFRV